MRKGSGTCCLRRIFSKRSGVGKDVFISYRGRPSFASRGAVICKRGVGGKDVFKALSGCRSGRLFRRRPRFCLCLPSGVLGCHVFSYCTKEAKDRKCECRFPRTRSFRAFLSAISSCESCSANARLSTASQVIALSAYIGSEQGCHCLMRKGLDDRVVARRWGGHTNIEEGFLYRLLL